MKNHITRRHALALTASGLATSCADNKAFLQPQGASVQDASTGTWTTGLSLPFPVQEIYPCAHNGAIHLAGGFVAENGQITEPTASHSYFRPDQYNRPSLYETTANISPSWGVQLPLPVARHHPHLISFKGQLLILAGFESPPDSIGWVMQSTGWRATERKIGAAEIDVDRTGNILEGTARKTLTARNWAEAPILPAPSAEAVVGVLGDGALHLAGGRTPIGEANANWNDHGDTDHHFVLADLNGKWETAAPCLTKRNSAAGDVINGNLHIVGGRTVGGGNVATHEVYDHKEDRWRTAAPMPQAQGGLAAAALGSTLYAFGGEYFDNGGGVYKEAWAYDATTDAWSPIPDMPNPRHGLGAVALDGKIYVIGGALQASGVDTSAIVDIYSP